MSITKTKFGITPAGDIVNNFEISNDNGVKAVVSEYGAILVSLFVPDKNGKVKDVVLGYDKLSDYYTNNCHFGSTIGRNGNRIENAKFEINGVEYKLKKNDGENNLHSGPEYYAKRLWTSEVDEAKNAIKFSLSSPHGDQGYPGNFEISVTYSLSKCNELEIHYEGISDKDTVANLTNHTYFNLSGHDSGDILSHKLWLKASNFTPVKDAGSIPTGELAKVAGTPFDFSIPTAIGDRINSDHEQMIFGNGYDHNFAIDRDSSKVEKFATATDKDELITMEVYTDCVGVQFYSGNFIGEHEGKAGVTYNRRHGFCLETQFFPNSINDKNFDSPLLKAGEKYETTTIYKFN